MTTETYQYRGYDIVPMWQWSSWCTGIYATRPDLPVMSRSTLSTMAPQRRKPWLKPNIASTVFSRAYCSTEVLRLLDHVPRGRQLAPTRLRWVKTQCVTLVAQAAGPKAPRP